MPRFLGILYRLLATSLAIFLVSINSFSQNYNHFISINPKYTKQLVKTTAASSNLLLTKLAKSYKVGEVNKVLYRIDGLLSPAEVAKIQAMRGVHYIEPARAAFPLVTPSDPAAQINGGQAAHLTKLEAYAAWDSTQGDTTVIISILDTGTDILHPDMAGNLAKNHADPINGLDDDGNGYVDDYNGWDIANRDNNPRPDNNPHGTQVACIASATTNNSIGMAGLGYKCRYLPVKVFGNRFAGYEGILYAADRGAKVINLSWGANGYPSQFEQDVIDYAVRVKGAVVVASAGNTPGTLRFFPASYKGVIAVGFTQLTDGRDPTSTSSFDLDVMAPGTNVHGILSNGTYGNIGGGSSFAAPMVSALAGLVRTKYPTLSPAEVEARIKQGSDWVDTFPSNRNTAGFLGKGRINFRKSLHGPLTAYPELISVTPNPLNAHYGVGVCSLSIGFRNHLAPARLIKIRLQLWDTVANRGARLVGPDTTIFQNIPANAAFTIPETFGYHLAISQAQGGFVKLLVTIWVDGKLYHQTVALPITQFGQDLHSPNTQLTLGSNARVGYFDVVNSYGSGFTRLGRRLLGEGGIIIAQDSLDVRNNITNTTTKDNDFSPLYLKMVKADTLQILEGVCQSPAPQPGAMGLRVGVKGYAWPNRSDRPGIITEHTIENTGTRMLDSLRFGLFADWNLNNLVLNQMRWDTLGGFGYCYAFGDTAYTALVPLSPNLTHGMLAIDAVPLTVTGNINVTDGFSRAEKWRTLFRERRSAGGTGGTNNLATHHTKLPALAPNAQHRVAYAWIAGPSLPALRTQAQQSKLAYQLLRRGQSWLIANQFSNCLGDSLRITLPPGLWQVADSAGNIRTQTRDSLWITPTKISTQLRVRHVDSLFPGPETILTINSRLLRDTLPNFLFGFVNTALPLPSSPALATDSTQIRILGMSVPFEINALGPIDTIRVPEAGIFTLCRRIRTPEGCQSEVCDSLKVTPTVSVKELTSTNQLVTPNPAFAHLTLPTTTLPQEIWDGNGRKVWSGASVGEKVNVSTWPRGLYLWKAGKHSERILLQ